MTNISANNENTLGGVLLPKQKPAIGAGAEQASAIEQTAEQLASGGGIPTLTDDEVASIADLSLRAQAGHEEAEALKGLAEVTQAEGGKRAAGIKLSAAKKEKAEVKKLETKTAAGRKQLIGRELQRIKEAREEFETQKQRLEEDRDTAISEFDDKKSKLDEKIADAQTRYNNRMNTITNEANRVRAQDPSVPIFKSTWGIAAMLIGSLRQGLFGGENNAENILNKKLTMAVRQQTMSLQSLKESGSKEASVLQTIRDSSDSQLEYLEGVKKALLDDIAKNITSITKQYNMDMKTSDEHELMMTIEKIGKESAQKVIDADSDIAAARADLAREANNVEATATRQLAETKLPSAMETKDAAAFGKQLETDARNLVDIFRTYGDLAKWINEISDDDGRGRADRIKAFFEGKFPLAFVTKKGAEARAAGARVALALFGKLKKAQGAKVSDKDFEVVEAYFGGGKIEQADLELAFEHLAHDVRMAATQFEGLLMNSIDPRDTPDPRVTKRSVIRTFPSITELTDNPILLKLLRPIIKTMSNPKIKQATQ